MFFAYNGSKRIMGLAPTGAHTADIEEFYVELTKSGEVAFYGMSTHGDLNIYNVKPGYETSVRNHPKFKDDKLVSKSRDLKLEGSHQIIYSAVNAHAFYGSPGSYRRFGWMGNDVTAKGLPVRPKVKNVFSSFFFFIVRFGRGERAEGDGETLDAKRTRRVERKVREIGKRVRECAQ